ncbi:XrtB/PEP-CTERM-associated transcriptional regulator EpsA [Nitrosospira sp. Nsp13]|jgi:transcriptional regulator EpsA|uniref:XrtB/PEP-CTERM-associated transcriptional regulator EpsA n=1 Tax=Nitrosospira sp. Nsp13 TaxID=1855332 RepID=UPI000886ED21|nr:XrtB/PEP-CTERM-associated transcriptional regulator EpsA [Nitrosospira sp. Nsp13]SCY60352.1 transcriptional regulator EpsA [Nitrosospira sp. Nsp13]
MGFFSSLSSDHLQRYARIIQEGIAVRGHLDLFRWLQGEVQHYLPHEIMLAAWGDFSSNFIRYDIVSALPGVRTVHLEPEVLSPLLRKLYNRWDELGRMACASSVRPDALYEDGGLQCSFGQALQGMHSSLMHGISDKRGRHDCLYVFFSSKDELDSTTLSAMEILLPYLDTALRRVAPLSYPSCAGGVLLADSLESEDHGLSERESEIMNWVKMGKTNAEIGSILSISAFTVKNHLQHIFKKLDVYNRMQAVSKIERSLSHG